MTMMLKETLLKDSQSALKDGNKARLSALRFALSKMRECDSDESVMLVLKKLIKSHQDAFEQFTNAGRVDLAENEKASMAFLEVYLPEPLSDEAIDELIDQAISESGATSPKDMGRVMGALQSSVGMGADMKQVSQKVKARLSAQG